MTWEIRVWHEDVDGLIRLCLEASPTIPDEVVASIAGSYWLENVEYTEEDWDEDTSETPGPRLQG